MASYEPAVIQEFADQLYARARAIVIELTARWALLLALLCGAVAAVTREVGPGPAALVGLFLGGYIGYTNGKARAFELKLQAQTALCQMHIENNTRVAAAMRQVV